MLEVRALTKRLKKHVLLEDVSFCLAQGKCLAVLGPSGCGKTTLLRILLGVEAPTSGEILWNGQLLSRCETTLVPPEQRGFGMVFQDAALFPHLNVRENVAFGLRMPGTPEEWLKRFSAEHLAKRRIDRLSGGERQRVALARAMAAKPRLLLLDEPFSSVDRMVRREILAMLVTVLQESSTATILVTHDARDAADLADTLIVLRDGKIAQSGELRAVMDAPASEWVERFLDQDQPQMSAAHKPAV